MNIAFSKEVIIETLVMLSSQGLLVDVFLEIHIHLF